MDYVRHATCDLQLKTDVDLTEAVSLTVSIFLLSRDVLSSVLLSFSSIALTYVLELYGERLKEKYSVALEADPFWASNLLVSC